MNMLMANAVSFATAPQIAPWIRVSCLEIWGGREGDPHSCPDRFDFALRFVPLAGS